jgi:FAD/FMN-containing dehydrogenase
VLFGRLTGLAGAAVPVAQAVAVSMDRMHQIEDVNARTGLITVQAGVTLQAVQEAAVAAGWVFGVDLGARGSCQIGGNVSTNAGGNGVLQNGMMREQVLGLEVVLADGRVLPMLKTLHKDNSGYDLKQIFIGSEGTLGVVTAATLRLFARPAQSVVAFVAAPSPAAALALLGHMQARTGGLLSAFELISRQAMDLLLRHIPGTRDPLDKPSPWYVLIEVSGGGGAGLDDQVQAALADAMAQNFITDAVIAHNQAQAKAFWHLRESISESQKREGASIKHDISVPVAAIPAFIEKATAAVLAKFPGARPVTFGHLGDGNLHFNFNSPPSSSEGGSDAQFLAEWDEIQLTVHDIVKEFSGSISAEHGIGTMKRDLLLRYKSTGELDAMRALKSAFDPKNILNPGKTVPPVSRL